MENLLKTPESVASAFAGFLSTHDLESLYVQFNKMDVNQSGEIGLKEFASGLGEPFLCFIHSATLHFTVINCLILVNGYYIFIRNYFK